MRPVILTLSESRNGKSKSVLAKLGDIEVRKLYDTAYTRAENHTFAAKMLLNKIKGSFPREVTLLAGKMPAWHKFAFVFTIVETDQSV